MAELKLHISPDKLTARISVLSTDLPTREELQEFLQKNRIYHGLLPEAIEQLTATRSGEPVVVARGTPPQPGQHGYVELLWEKSAAAAGPDREKATVDFRETSKLISVPEGEVVAILHDPVPGQPGQAVTGEAIAPPPVKAARIKAGKNITLTPDGRQAVAQKAGRPVAKQAGLNWLLTIEDRHTVPGDVSIKTGNIRFKGDVVVKGNVLETMTVEAAGNLTVEGLVTGATILCGESLLVNNNIISSTVTAGLGFAECGKISYLIEEIYNSAIEILKAVEQIKSKLPHPEKFTFHQLVDTVLQGRFGNLQKTVRELEQIKTFNLPYEVAEAIEAVKVLGDYRYTAQDFRTILQSTALALNIIKGKANSQALITARAVFNSTLQCSGPIIITGQGCTNAQIYAGGDVHIKGSFKGGNIHSDGNVFIGELGNPMGLPHLVKLRRKGQLTAQKVYPGVTVQIGSSRLSVKQEMFKVKFKLDERAEVAIIPV
ncbi:MAG: DUF342 domain-containing protein [Desulfurispora sp.]|uniref:DUF342 domain-containing protein n=1 Tax=Desulfurispora sp. TaxID=3014275 RepID=UPI00404AB227